MSEVLLSEIQRLVAQGSVEICDHAYEQMLMRGIDIEQVIDGAKHARLLEDYSKTRGIPRLLVEQPEPPRGKIEVVWELEIAGPPKHSPCVLVTAYRPDRGA